MKLEVGMYVRTRLGIGKILDVSQYDITIHLNKITDMVLPICEKNFKKSSYVIKELIEVGDYINGSRVAKINCNFEYVDNDADTGVDEVDDGIETEKEFIYFDSEIETVLTHEQFETYCYKVGDE